MPDPELDAMQQAFAILKPLEPAARKRAYKWVGDRLGIESATKPDLSRSRAQTGEGMPEGQGFDTFADLFNAALPNTNADKALTAAYWLQVVQGQDQFGSQGANKELQQLGHVLLNITDAFRQLQNKKPALAIQVKKSGRSQQARKLYKLTQAGIDVIESMI